MVSTKPGFSGTGVIILFSLLFCLKFSFKRQLERTKRTKCRQKGELAKIRLGTLDDYIE